MEIPGKLGFCRCRGAEGLEAELGGRPAHLSPWSLFSGRWAPLSAGAEAHSNEELPTDLRMF